MIVLIIASNIIEAAIMFKEWADKKPDGIRATKIEERDFLIRGAATKEVGMALPETLLDVA